MNERPLPPIIQDWITKILDPNTKPFIRDNYRAMLTNVVASANEAIAQYDKDKALMGAAAYVNEKRKRA